jgi:putative hydrolase of the HAD superfamily
LKPEYRTFILSNTNKIHYDFYTKLINEKHGIPGLESLVEKAYFSHEINLKKPYKDIYEYVLSDSNLIPEETIFIDDNQDNIEAAKKLGIETIWLTENNLEYLKIWANEYKV